LSLAKKLIFKKEPNRNSGIQRIMTEMKISLKGASVDSNWRNKELASLSRD
jgi:SRSO17 transposase